MHKGAFIMLWCANSLEPKPMIQWSRQLLIGPTLGWRGGSWKAFRFENLSHPIFGLKIEGQEVNMEILRKMKLIRGLGSSNLGFCACRSPPLWVPWDQRNGIFESSTWKKQVHQAILNILMHWNFTIPQKHQSDLGKFNIKTYQNTMDELVGLPFPNSVKGIN